MDKDTYWERNKVTWGISYDNTKVTVSAKSFKCKDINYEKV